MSFLDVLQWIGESLDKPGAAARGLAAGQFDQLANLIPFSDTMGLTDPRERISGRDLLGPKHWGVLGENQAGLDAGDVAGFGLEMLLDPMNLAGLGGMVRAARAGKAVQAANQASDAMRAAGALPEELLPQAQKLYRYSETGQDTLPVPGVFDDTMQDMRLAIDPTDARFVSQQNSVPQNLNDLYDMVPQPRTQVARDIKDQLPQTTWMTRNYQPDVIDMATRSGVAMSEADISKIANNRANVLYTALSGGNPSGFMQMNLADPRFRRVAQLMADDPDSALSLMRKAMESGMNSNKSARFRIPYEGPVFEAAQELSKAGQVPLLRFKDVGTHYMAKPNIPLDDNTMLDAIDNLMRKRYFDQNPGSMDEYLSQDRIWAKPQSQSFYAVPDGPTVNYADVIDPNTVYSMNNTRHLATGRGPMLLPDDMAKLQQMRGEGTTYYDLMYRPYKGVGNSSDYLNNADIGAGAGMTLDPKVNTAHLAEGAQLYLPHVAPALKKTPFVTPRKIAMGMLGHNALQGMTRQ